MIFRHAVQPLHEEEHKEIDRPVPEHHQMGISPATYQALLYILPHEHLFVYHFIFRSADKYRNLPGTRTAGYSGGLRALSTREGARDKLLCVLILRVQQHLVRQPAFHDLTAPHDGYAVCHVVYHAHVVGNKQI